MYDVCNGTGPNTSATLTLNVGSGSAGTPQGAAAGDVVVVCAGSNAGGTQTITGVTDSQSNTYAAQVADTSQTNKAALWTSKLSTALVAGTDTITVTWSSVSGSKVAVVKGVTGVTSATADQTNHNGAVSAAPNSGSSGVLPQASELVVGVICCAAAGGQPGSLSSGTAGTTAHASGTGYLTEFDQTVSSTSAISMSGTILSTNWCALVATFPLSTGGGGGGLTVTSTSPPRGTKGTAYSYSLTATGGTGSGYTWSIQMGTTAGPTNSDSSSSPAGYYFPPGLQFGPAAPISARALGAVITGVSGGSSGLAAEYAKWGTAPSSGYGIYSPKFTKIYANVDLVGYPTYSTAAQWESHAQHVGSAMTGGYKMIVLFEPTAKGTTDPGNWPGGAIFPDPTTMGTDWTNLKACLNSIISACSSLSNGSGVAGICLWNETDGHLQPFQSSYLYKYYYPLMKAEWPHIPVGVNFIWYKQSSQTSDAFATEMAQRTAAPSPVNPSGWGDGGTYIDGIWTDIYGEGFDGSGAFDLRYWYAEPRNFTPGTKTKAATGVPGPADMADFANVSWGNIETGNSASGGTPTMATVQDYLIGHVLLGKDVSYHSMYDTILQRQAANLPFFGSSWYENLNSTGAGHITDSSDYRISCLNALDALTASVPTADAAITGTPTVNGSWPMTFIVTDNGGNTASASANLIVGTGTLTLAVATPAGALPDGTGNQDYSTQTVKLQTNGGGTGTGYTWSIHSGSLTGSGITLNSDGSLTGVCTNPSSSTTYTFTAHVVDSGSNSANSGTYTITVDPGTTALSVTTTTLATGVVGTAYSFTLQDNGGGTGTGYSWTLSSGSLSGSGISLATSGKLSGSAPVLGTYPGLVFKVTDSGGNTASSGSLTLTVSSSAPTLAVTTTALAAATAGTAYSFTLQDNGGGTGTGYTWSLTSGSLTGSGISLASSGLLSGSTPVAGTYSGLVFTVTDSGSHTANSGSLTLTVNAVASNITINNPDPLPSATTGIQYTQSFSVAGGTPPYTISLAPGSPPLPPGLSIDNSDPVEDESGNPVTDELGSNLS